MKRLLASFAFIALTVCCARAETTSIVIEAPWLRATPKSAPVAGGYATISNTGATPDRLVSASLPIAPEGQVHSMSMQGSTMHMERLAAGLTIPPGGTVILTPGGNHLMFLKPTAPLKEGESMKGTMVFEKAGTIAVTFVVGGMAAKSAPGSTSHETKSHETKSHDMKGHDMQGIDMPGMH